MADVSEGRQLMGLIVVEVISKGDLWMNVTRKMQLK